MKAILLAACSSLILAGSSLAGGNSTFQKASFKGFVGVGGDPGDRGGVSVTTTATGGYTIKGSIAGRSVSVKGAFDQNRQVVKDINIKLFGVTIATIHLEMTLAMDGESIIGHFDYKGKTYGFTIYRAFYSKSVTTVHAGRFTALLPSPGGDYPGGTGYATVTITSAGVVKVAGKLADGATISTGGSVSVVAGNDQFPVFNILYKRKGALAGFASFSSTDKAAGSLVWVKTDDSGALDPADYSGTNVNFNVQRYVVPAPNTTAVLPGLDMNGSVIIEQQGGNLNPNLTKNGTLSTKNKLTVTSPNDEKVKATVSKTTGLVTGSFKVTLMGATKPATLTLRGIVHQDPTTPKVEGYFIGGDKSGVFRIVPD